MAEPDRLAVDAERPMSDRSSHSRLADRNLPLTYRTGFTVD
jgi:hypothetical protein